MSAVRKHLSDVIAVKDLGGLRRPPRPRQLLASIDGRQVGTLSEADTLWAFTYSREWLARPDNFPLAPSLPLQDAPIQDGASFRPVQWYFDNLLPEEAQRQLMAADAKVDSADAFALLAFYGAESAGSLTLLEQGDALAPGRMEELPDTVLSERIRGLPAHSLAATAPKRMSLAGAQHKLAVIERGGALFQPTGAEASTHILKPDNVSGHYPHSVANEWFVMRLAGRMGLEVPRVSRRYVPEPVFLIERFDRQAGTDGVARLHAIDACQLLNMALQFKYQGSVETLRAIAMTCRERLVTRIRLYQWLVFNALVGNSDAHLKNLSFLVDHDGVHLAAHYDLLCTVCYESMAYEGTQWPDASTLAWPIMDAPRFADLRAGHLIEAGGVLGLPETMAADLLERQRSRIGGEADRLLGEVEGENATMSGGWAMGARLEGEMRCLRAIRHVVVQEMVERLKRR